MGVENSPENLEFDGLTQKQRVFCHEYIVDLNSTQAAIRAGYSEKTAGSIGHENLNKPEIAKKIQELMDLRVRRTEITADKVLVELSKIAFCDVRNIFNKNNELLMPSEYGDETAASVQSIEVVTKDLGAGSAVEYIHKVKFSDKRAALEALGKNLKLFTERKEVEHGVTDELARLMAEIDGSSKGLPGDDS